MIGLIEVKIWIQGGLEEIWNFNIEKYIHTDESGLGGGLG